MTSPAITTFAARLAEKEAQLKTEQQLRQALETRTAVQIQKLADNNAALARMNHRLGSQLDRLKAEQDQLEHLTAGQAAVARAKESELAAEIKGLKHLLKESLAERATLHAQLVAKQEIVRYLEWRLAQMEQLAEGKERAAGGGPLSAAFKEAAQVAAGEPPLDSFPVLPDTSVSTQSSSVSGTNLPRTLLALGQRGLVGIPTTAWAPSSEEAEKENAIAQLHLRQDTTATPGTVNPGQFTPIRSSVRSALGDITPRRHPRPAADEIRNGDATPAPAAIVAAAAALATDAREEEEDEEAERIHGEATLAAGAKPASPLLEAEENGESDGLFPPSELEGSSSAAVPSTDLKKQLFAEYSSADLTYEDSDKDDDEQEVSKTAAVKVLAKKKSKKDDGLDVVTKQMHTPIAEQEKTQNFAATPDINNNTNTNTNTNKNSVSAVTPAGPSPLLFSPSSTPAIGLRSSSRVRRSVSYALPPVNRKLRQGDPFTFGDPTSIIRKKNTVSSSAAATTTSTAGAAAASSTGAPRSRTKPRAKYASSFKKPRRKSFSIRCSGNSEEDSPLMATPPHVGAGKLPAMAEQEDFSENGDDAGAAVAVEVTFC